MVIGIVGESGVGKSTATSFFQSKGAYIISADLIVKYVYQLPETKARIIKELGQEFLNQEDYTVNLLALRKYAFENYQFLSKLEQLIWPEMKKIIINEINQHKSETLVVLDCAVLFNAKLDYLVNKVLLIKSPRELQIKRIKARDHVTDYDAANLLNLQKSHLILDKKVDFVINNNRSLQDYLSQLTKLFKNLTKKPKK
ncbi:MAG: dephospho-CoA kinase [Spiroplasma sp.]|nr:dephospho-CoA kinase [Spiroplasma sp.]